MRNFAIVSTIVLTACVGSERVEFSRGEAEVRRLGNVQSKGFALSTPSGILVANGMTLEWLSAIDPPAPALQGGEVFATDVAFDGDRLVAIYNTKDGPHRGAMQVIDVSDPEAPKVLVNAAFSQTDLNRVVLEGDYAYLAGGDATLLASLDTISLNNGQPVHESVVDLPSWQTTMLAVDGDRAFATSGDAGGVSVLDLADPANPQVLSFLPLDDARYVVPYGADELLLVAGGSQGGTVIRQGLPDDGGSWPPAKATVQVEGMAVGAPSWGGLYSESLYVCTDAHGVAAFAIDDGGIQQTQVIPTTGDANGMSLTPDGRLAFLANGQQGLLVVDVQQSATAEQKAEFDVPDDWGSANATALRHDLVALADGRGGVKLLRFALQKVGGKVVTILMALSEPHVTPEMALKLARQAVDWTTPNTPASILVVRDDSHHNEHPTDAQTVTDLLKQAGYIADFVEEPADGLEPADVAGYDVVWFTNPGWPWDDKKSYETLLAFSQAGGGLILQGDDIAWSTTKPAFSIAPLNHIEYVNNGTMMCGKKTDNNKGLNYKVTFEVGDHPVLAGLQGQSLIYGNDIDHTKPLGEGEQVLAWATLNNDPSCTEKIPVVVAFSP